MAIISILFLMMSIVYADYLYNSNQVSFNNNNTTLTSTDVQSAIDELYNKCSNIPSVGTCPEGYECTELNKVTYNANGGTFSGGGTTNDIYYSVVEGDIIEKISKTSNVDDNGNRLSGTNGYMPQASSGITDTVTIEEADSLEVEITYQTRSSSYSWVTVNDSSITPTTSNYSSSVSGKLYGTTTTTKTYTITGNTVKFFFYNSRAQNNSYSNYLGYYAKIKGKKNNEYIKDLNVATEEGEYSEPTRTGGYTFAGWTLNQDGSGTVYQSEQEAMNSLDAEDRNVVLYALYKHEICKRATTLHTETCNSDTLETSQYCRGDGYSAGSTITYGKLGTEGNEPTAGDAFDCDVNGDGVYNPTNERFYYVSNYYDTRTKEFNSNYAVFIYYKVTSSYTSWYSSNSTSYGPTIAIAQLPTTSQWSNVSLMSTTRDILYEGGSIVKSNFSYEGYAARLLTIQELKSGCSNASTSTGSMSSCNYFFEGTRYAKNNTSLAPRLWLESVSTSSSPSAVSITYRSLDSNSASGSNGIRPAIEVRKIDVSY